MKDATEKPIQALIYKYSFESQENNLKMCHEVLSRSQASSNSRAENGSKNSEGTKMTNSTLNMGPSISS